VTRQFRRNEAPEINDRRLEQQLPEKFRDPFEII
jgi:hypothetical protein